MGMRSPIATPRPKDTPLRKPVKDPGPVATATLVILFRRTVWRSCAMKAGSRDGMNSSDQVPSSIVATAATADDVSMTKITVHPDQAAIAAEVLDLDQGRAWHLQAVTPLDDDCALAGQVFEAQVRQLGHVLDPVQIHVGQLYVTRVDAHQLKGGAGNGRGRPGAARHPADEGGLAGPELARQQHHVAHPQALAKGLAGGLCLGGGARRDLVLAKGPSRVGRAPSPLRRRQPPSPTSPRS